MLILSRSMLNRLTLSHLTTLANQQGIQIPPHSEKRDIVSDILRSQETTPPPTDWLTLHNRLLDIEISGHPNPSLPQLRQHIKALALG